MPLALTIAIEPPIVAAVFPKQRRRMALVCALVTGVTNILMNTAWAAVAPSYGAYLVVGESGALAVEGLVYALVSRPPLWGRALVASATANAVSFAVGGAVLASMPHWR